MVNLLLTSQSVINDTPTPHPPHTHGGVGIHTSSIVRKAGSGPGCLPTVEARAALARPALAVVLAPVLPMSMVRPASAVVLAPMLSRYLVRVLPTLFLGSLSRHGL